jgi:hypothetical protein
MDLDEIFANSVLEMEHGHLISGFCHYVLHQSSVLSPVFFNVFVSERVDSFQFGSNTTASVFADDINYDPRERIAAALLEATDHWACKKRVRFQKEIAVSCATGRCDRTTGQRTTERDRTTEQRSDDGGSGDECDNCNSESGGSSSGGSALGP